MTNEEAIQYLAKLRDSFLDVYANCEADVMDYAISALSRDRWISVEERLPEDGKAYLVVVKQKWKFETDWDVSVDVASNYGSYIDGYWDTFNDWCEGQETHITHWRPLPEPPKEEKTIS